ncbi:replicative DNA helicase [Methylobacterium sp. WSM2598]|uniref:replicative DNA helicase n=1 Tax=Methylobacterium sp. WSM2598 TaxID=398261 RepID=UPI00036971D4|nr:DnaB-like helicase C-terminal domain-containing protein [Methylobacterium sp. WSM2598]
MSGRVVPFAAPALDETLPHSVETEQALLGAILNNNDALSLVTALVAPEHFFVPEHATIFQQIAAMVGAGLQASPITLKPYLGDADLGGLTVGEYLARLAAEATTVSGAPGYAQIIRSLATRRDLVRAAQRLQERARFSGAEVTSDEIIDGIEGDLLDARAASPKAHLAGMSAGEGAAWMLERIEAMRAGQLAVPAIPTGIPDLDRATAGGFGRGQLWLLAGRPGMGKTVSMTALSRYAARNDGVLVFQLEVTRDQMMARYFADLAYASHKPLTFGAIMHAVDLDDEDMWRLRDAQKRLDRLHLRIECEPGISLAQIAASVKAQKKRLERVGQRLGVVFIDYLKFIKTTDRYKSNRVLEIGEISGGLKTLAKAEDICVVLLTQLNRGVEAEGRADRRPSLADLRDSGELEQDADVVLFLYREAYYLEKKLKASSDPEIGARFIEKRNALEMALGKNRMGPTPTLDLWVDVASSTIASHARGPA